MATEQQANARQSRVGKIPVEVPAGVEVTLMATEVTLKGPKGQLTRPMPQFVDVSKDGNKLTVSTRPEAGFDAVKFQGLTRALLASWIEGVAKGYQKSLDMYGVGYRAEVKDAKLTIQVGLSHSVTIPIPAQVQCKIEIIDEAGQKRPRVHLTSHDKEVLGQFAAYIRSKRPPEPYKGKGVRYVGERVRQKAGKAAAKGKA